MSTQRGNATRTRSQKHRNRTVFRNDMHDKTPKQMMLNSLHISEVCQHCKGVIEWKIKYKKYKPLSQPKTCTRCQQRNIRKAYHVLCRDCARETKVCAKCLKSAEEVDIEPAQPTPQEQLQLKVEMERLIKSFPERKRRAFLRYMARGKKQDTEGHSDTESTEAAKDDEAANGAAKVKPHVPHSRDELLEKIEQLKLATNNDDDDSDLSWDSDNYSETGGQDEDSSSDPELSN